MRWGTDLSSFVVFIGESGDTDYEGLLGGVHKTIIIKEICADSSKLHVNHTYPLDHVIPVDCPNLFHTEGHSVDNIREVLSKIGISKA